MMSGFQDHRRVIQVSLFDCRVEFWAGLVEMTQVSMRDQGLGFRVWGLSGAGQT